MICGPTAAGKTAIGIAIAEYFGGEIVSADSRQFYREMTIGTAKPLAEEMRGIRHHFVDSRAIDQALTAGEFGRLAEKQILGIHRVGKLPIIVGGSGLYIRALTEGLDDLPSNENLRNELISQFNTKGIASLIDRLTKSDPKAIATIDGKNKIRVMRAIELVELSGKTLAELRNQSKPQKHFRCVPIGIRPDRDELYRRIDLRVDEMMARGLEAEAHSLLPFREMDALKTVGYKELFGYFDGDYDLQEAIRLVKRNSRHYAKRQLTWFRKIPGIKWFSPNEVKGVVAHIISEVPQGK